MEGHTAARPAGPGFDERSTVDGRGSDLLGRRWALRILWELHDGPIGLRALRERCDGMSSSVLYERLDELAVAGLLAQDADGDYVLTAHGGSLGRALQPLDRGHDSGPTTYVAPDASLTSDLRRRVYGWAMVRPS